MYRIRLAIPPHLREITVRLYGVRQEFTRSLGTKSDREAKGLGPAVIDEFQGFLKAAEAEHCGTSVRLSDREISTLCGRWLSKQDALACDNIPEDQATYEGLDDFLTDVVRGEEDDEQENYIGEAIAHFKDDLAQLLGARGVHVDPNSRRRLVARLSHVKWQHVRDMLKRLRTGTWQPSRGREFPTAAVSSSPSASPGKASFDDLVTGWGLDHQWQRDVKPMARPLYDRIRTIERLAGFLGHRDAAQVTKDDAVRWKTEMQGRALGASTVRNDLSEMAAVWKWGLAHGKVAANPFAGILPPKAVRKGRDVRAFAPDEIKAILLAARGQTGLLRWMPWLLCMTGARLGEAAQSTKQDIENIDGILCLRIHDEEAGRSLKNADSRRTIPLHPALVAEGFLDYVAALPSESTLWPDVRPDKMFGQRSGPAGRKVAKWLHGALKLNDPRISPNHSWRHTFIQSCRRVVMPIEVRSALTGHSAKMDESSEYGDGMKTMIRIMSEHLARLPAPLPPEDQPPPSPAALPA